VHATMNRCEFRIAVEYNDERDGHGHATIESDTLPAPAFAVTTAAEHMLTLAAIAMGAEFDFERTAASIVAAARHNYMAMRHSVQGTA
jgi:hypothetical protein